LRVSWARRWEMREIRRSGGFELERGVVMGGKKKKKIERRRKGEGMLVFSDGRGVACSPQGWADRKNEKKTRRFGTKDLLHPTRQRGPKEGRECVTFH